MLAGKGSHEAFEALIKMHERRIYGLALYLLKSPDDAADAAQESFVRCYTSLSSFDHQRSFGAWLYRIAYNHCLDVLRSRRRERIVPLVGNRQDDVVNNAPDPQPGVEDRVEQMETTESVTAALDHLTDDYRHILVLKYTLDLSYAEMAEILSVPESTITMRLHHAKAALRRQLRTTGEEDAGSS